MTDLRFIAPFLVISVLLGGCGGNVQQQDELSRSELLVRERAGDLGAPDERRSGWTRFNLLSFDVPWGSRESESSNEYINAMFHRRFDNQGARYAAMVDDALRAELELEAFVVAAQEVAQEDEERLAGLIALMAAGLAQSEDIIISMSRVRNNRTAVDEGLAEARSWEQTFSEVRDRAEMELPNSRQVAQLSRSVNAMGRWADELMNIADRMSTSTERVAAEFMDRAGR